jgi:hypothetical protein
LYDAALGHRVRRPKYERDAEIESGTAGRDIRMMVTAELIVARGEARARHYIGTPKLRAVWYDVRGLRQKLENPYHRIINDAEQGRRMLHTATS